MLVSKIRLKWSSLLLAVVLVLSSVSAILPVSHVQAAQGTGTTYYVDSQGGSDSNDGKSSGAAWKSLTIVNQTTFQPGDRILFKAGSEWKGQQLYPKGSGESGNPIVIDIYGGATPKPKFSGAAAIDSVVNFENQQYWEINNLEITNTAAGAPADPSKLADLRGIHVAGRDAGVLKHFYLKNLFIHDITGWDWWIGGSSASDVPGSGFAHGTGWDASKRTGGILFETLQPGANPVPTKFDDVIIENSVFQDNSFGGIIFKQYENGVNWASRDDGKGHSSPSDSLGQWYDPQWVPHTNITIRNNYFSQYNSDFACDTIYLTSVQNALVEHNVSAGAGTSAIEMYYADNVTVQYNEIYDTTAKAGGADSNAIDPDKESTNILIQYNYIHDTGDGILLCGFTFGTATVRYNILKDAAPAKRFLNPHGDKGTQLVYNNIFYNTRAGTDVTFVNSSGGSAYLNDSDYFVKLYNNIFYNAAGGALKTVTIASGTGTTYDNNVYYGQNVAAPNGDAHAVLGDPKFAGPAPTTKGNATTGPILDMDVFRLLSGSSAIGNGLDGVGMNLSNSTMTFTDNGGKDFAGQALYNGKPDIGAFEYYGALNSGTEAITGVVKDAGGALISGADVSVTVGGTKYSAVSNTTGFYSILNVPVGTNYTVTASKTFYYDGTVNNVSVVAGDTTSGVHVTMISTNPTGAISGTVKDTSTPSSPPVVAGANVSISDNTNTVVATAVTDASGNFTVSNLAAKSGYSVTVAKQGYQPWTVTTLTNVPIAVTAGTTTSIGTVYLSPGKPIYVVNDNFDSYNVGSAPTGWTATTNVAGASIGVAANPSASDKSVWISQPTKGSGSSQKTVLSKPLNNLKGIVSIEYAISKSNTSDYFTVPAVNGNSTSNIAVTVGMDSTGILYKDGGSSGVAHVIQAYTVGTWYNFKIILNTITKKFDLYINNVKKLDQAAFRFTDSTTDYLTGVDFTAAYNVTGSVYLNNFRISSGIAYPVNDTDLTSLTVSQGALTQVDKTHYYLNVPNYVNQLTLTPTADSIFAKSISVNGSPVASGQASQSIPLSDGDNAIPVVVTAEDGTTTGTYTVTVNRTPTEIDATLKNLTVSSGTLSPAFTTDTTSYTVSVPYSVDQLNITPVTSAPGATLMLNDVEISNGLARNVALAEGVNTFVINVNSVDGTNNQDYSVTATRAPNPNGRFQGVVKDTLGNPVSGVAVSVTGNGQVYTSTTNALGAYNFSDIVPGAGYTITASKTGYNDANVTGFSAVAGTTTAVGDILLTLASQPPQLTTVTVSGTISALTAGSTGYDVSNLTVRGKDQYNAQFDLSAMPITWSLASGGASAVLSGSILTPMSVGTGTITATVNGVTSNPVGFAIVAASPTNTTSYQLTGPASVETGESLELTYGLTNVIDSVYAKSVTVNYDPTVLEYVNVSPLLNGFTVIGSSTAPGKVKIIEASTGSTSPVMGTVNLLSLSFRALNPSVSTNVYMTGVVIGDQYGNEQTLSTGTDLWLAVVQPVQVDKTSLSAVLGEAASAVANAKEIQPNGPNFGAYPSSAIEAIHAAILAANTVYGQTSATQSQVDDAKSALSLALTVFLAAANQSVSIGDLAVIARNYHAASSDVNWPSLRNYDLNKDGKLDIYDLVAMAQRILN
ncbi:hypothetical protein A8709_15060 [Paenibacillus pectinilyticus]|uniref:Probable pectate lyase C n=1 Tax=Paenibacillus pectinilyticus TaxID=512399 RepID=A0A1C1A4D2_9BACL|nr:carboxypeptidase regulatory-like domain-containing protein [Paenibacillus pectinilyticus]OCT15398.1 hypothetical protein A8709_15060 [Paenibacillus pectinilyticus]